MHGAGCSASSGLRTINDQPRKGEKQMYAKRILVMLIVTIAMGAMTARVNAQSAEKSAGAQSSESTAVTPSVLGTWEVTTTFPDGFRSKSIQTFAPGATSDMGSVFSTADIDLVPPVPCANQQGVYSVGEGLDIHTTFKGFCYNANFEPFGRLKIQQNITLGRLGNGFTGRAHVQIMRNDGSIEFETDATMRAVRMMVEPLP
jgi:hypothetical protein